MIDCTECENYSSFLDGQIDFRNKILEELEKRYSILTDLEFEASQENKCLRAQMYKDCRVEITETIKTINLIEL
jgi:hypothetical protein